jgi:aldehyde:ferredoxin oxidoreductase
MANEVFLGFLDPYHAAAKPEWVDFMENLLCGINSLQTCVYTTYAYVSNSWVPRYNSLFALKLSMKYLPKISLRLTDISKYHKFWSAVTGITITRAGFLRAGKRIHVLERYMNTREGISRKDDTLPNRLLTEGRECDPDKRTVPLDTMIDRYYKIKGYNKHGIPTKETLKKLGIE